MKSKRAILFKVGSIVLLLLIAGAMFIVGRGHTVYFDNKTLDYNGQTYSAANKVVVYINGEKVAKLAKRERGMATWIGQDFKMELEVTQEKGGETKTYAVSQKLPYSMDGIVLNLPGYLAGLPEEAYLTQFVSMIEATEEPTATEGTEGTDEFGLTTDF